MMTTLEQFPNEIFLIIFSYLSWDEMLTSFWSLNKRLTSLICLTFSINQSGIILTQPGLSYERFSSKFFSLISNSHLTSCIQRIHLDGRNSNAFILFNNNRNILHYPNLKSLILTKCYLSELLIENLALLIQCGLKELQLNIDIDILQAYYYENKPCLNLTISAKQRLLMFKQFICDLFSSKCQLTSLRLDVPYDGSSFINIHQCLSLSSHLCTNSISNKNQYRCYTLRYLHVHIESICFLEDLIEYVPNLEQLAIYLQGLWARNKPLEQSHITWSNKVEKLTYFIVKAVIDSYIELDYLKWIFNNLNHVKKMKLRLRIQNIFEPNSVINQCIVDANFIRKYLMSDIMINLIHLDFYIISKCELSLTNRERIIDSFKTNSFFLERQWTNVKYLFDPIKSYQHLSSSIIKRSQFLHELIRYPDIFDWPDIKYVELTLHSRIDLFLERFDQLFPNVSCIKFFLRGELLLNTLEIMIPPLETEEHRLTNIHLRHVTRLDFGLHFHRRFATENESMDKIKERARTLAQVISMPVQLNYLRIEKFLWLLHVIEYASDELRKEALSTVRYAEFHLPSCHFDSNKMVRVGNSLIPFLSTYMPRLQTLCLWKPDDLPWTSIRPDFKQIHRCILARQWAKTLQTLESINEHVTVFKQDLFHLVEQLKELAFLDIHCKIPHEKVEPYRSMVEKLFANSLFFIEISRFRLWI